MEIKNKVFLIQTGIAVTLSLLVPIFYVMPLWNEQYMQQIMRQWYKPLITDVMVIDESTGDHCPKGYNTLSTVFPGIGRGCMCTAVSKYAEVNNRVCSND